MNTIQSKDGTRIAYERMGSGPALILVDGALCSRAFGPMPKLAPMLARSFTVFIYDRRGRGDSSDMQPYAREREIEDLAALIQEAGGRASLVGLSSGAALALEAAAAGLPIDHVVAYEPPYMVDDGGRHAAADHEGTLRRLVAQGKRGAAVKYFMRDMVGVPAPFVFLMRLMFGMWKKLEAVAHTLPYDAAVMGNWSVPSERFATIRIPTFAMYGDKTDPRLKASTQRVRAVVPNASEQALAGQNHNVKPEVLSAAVAKILLAQ